MSVLTKEIAEDWYVETDAENLRTFEVISGSLKPDGRHLVQLPNVFYARERLPQNRGSPAPR